MLDFQSGIDDHLLEITHIIRGIDLQDSAKRQQFLYDYFDWSYPEVIHWGHVQVDAYDVAMSTSTIGELIDAGELRGWDDPRAPTLRSLRRRGIQGAAVTEAMIGLGTSTNDVDLAMSAIYAANRERIDAESDRRFFVRDSIEIPIGGQPPEAGTPPIHPAADRGRRTIPVGEAVLIEAADRPDREDRIWLKGLGCFRYTRDAFQYTGASIDVVRTEDVPVIHWVPATESVSTTLRTMDGEVTGKAEPGLCEQAVDDLVQFERVGFARIDAVEDDSIVAYFAHP